MLHNVAHQCIRATDSNDLNIRCKVEVCTLCVIQHSEMSTSPTTVESSA